MELKKRLSEFLEKIKEQKVLKILLILMIIAVLALTYAYFSKKTKDNKQTVTTANATIENTDLEKRLSDIISQIDGVGKTEVFVNYDGNEKVIGAIIVAEGANNETTRLLINQAARTALNVGSDCIKVYSMK